MAFYHCSIKTPKSRDGKFVPGQKHADYINREGEYKNYDDKTEIAAAHAQYINRQNDFAKENFVKKHGQCVYKANRLPKWADGSASKFFLAADIHGRRNSLSYREFEIALQEELTLEQNIEIVNTILNKYKYFQDKYYALAIHDKQAALDSGKKQIHCHIMVSDKIIDDREHTNERPAEQFFKTYCPVNTENGGAKVDRHFSKDSFGKNVTAFRKFYCDVTNAVFRKYGIDKSIDYRSLKMQREEALRQGDYVKAEILNREPEKYLGPIVSGDKNNPVVQNLLECRKLRSERENLIQAANEQEKILKDAQFISKINKSVNEADNIIRKDYSIKSAQIVTLKNSILFLTNQVTEARKNVLTYDAAKKLAKYNLMNKDEKTLMNKLYTLQKQERELQFEIKNTENTTNELSAKLETIQKCISGLKVQLRPVNKKFNETYWKSKITKNANWLLKENAPFRDKLELLQQNLDEQTAKFRELTVANIKNLHKEAYSAKEVKSVLDNLIINVKNSIAYKEQEYKSLLSRVVSPARAREMALDVFTNHQFKELRQTKKEIQKEKVRLEKDAQPILTKKDYAQRVGDSELLNECDIELSKFVSAYKEQLAKEKVMQGKFNELDRLCNTPQGQEKIQSIIDGILTKNSSIKVQFDTVKSSLSSLKTELKSLTSLSVGVNNQVRLDQNSNTKYFIKETAGMNVTTSGSSISSSTNQDIKILAQAFNGMEEVAPLIARIDDNTDEILDYTHLSTVDKKAKQTASILKEFS